MMSLQQPNHVSLLGIDFSRVTIQDALRRCERPESIGSSGVGRYVCFVNVHSLVESTRNSQLFSALKGAWMALSDGVPVVWASRLSGSALPGRVCGPDFMPAFLGRTRDESHGFIGGYPGQGEEIAQRFGLARAVSYSTPVRAFSVENAREDWARFLSLCPGARPPRFVWVGLGAPKQELWMQAVSGSAPDVVFFGVGAAFDFLSGYKSRAPRWAQQTGLEWLHRLASEPRRLATRYVRTNSAFLWLLSKGIFNSSLKDRPWK